MSDSCQRTAKCLGIRTDHNGQTEHNAHVILTKTLTTVVNVGITSYTSLVIIKSPSSEPGRLAHTHTYIDPYMSTLSHRQTRTQTPIHTLPTEHPTHKPQTTTSHKQQHTPPCIPQHPSTPNSLTPTQPPPALPSSTPPLDIAESHTLCHVLSRFAKCGQPVPFPFRHVQSLAFNVSLQQDVTNVPSCPAPRGRSLEHTPCHKEPRHSEPVNS